MRTLIEPQHSLKEILEIVKGEFSKASKLKRHPFKYVALNTSNGERVNSRYVVLRKFTEKESFLIFTDARSEKMADLSVKNNCSLLFFHDGKKLQVRVNGKAVVHQNNEVSQRYWNGVKGNSDKAYTSVLAPGEPIKHPEQAFAWNETLNDTHFVVLEIVPQEIDVLQLNRDQHIRARFSDFKDTLKASFLVP